MSFLFSHLSAECHYIAPQQPDSPEQFLTIIEKSDQEGETFNSILYFFNQMRDSSHQFCFHYLLRDAEQAKLFAKVMQIKAHEAHRFVPVIENCQYIESRHLGFSRIIQILDGSSVQEHVLIKQEIPAVIFIEEHVTLPNGDRLPGAFTAFNTVVEENGRWFFAGIYLYPEKPTDEQIENRKKMFSLTYENMLKFVEEQNVDAVLNSLHRE